MKRILVGAMTSLSIAGFAGQAAAADWVEAPQGLIFGGFADFEIGARGVKSTDDPEDNTIHFTASGTGALNIPISESISTQFDLQLEGYADTDEDEAAQHALAVGGHLSWRDPNAGLVGVFGGGANASAARGDEIDGDSMGFFVGAEAQIYLDNFTFYGQGGYGDYTYDGGDDEGFRDGWFVRGVARYFPHGDALIEAQLAYGETDEFIDGGDPGEFWNWGVKGKWRLSDDTPIYGIVHYRGGDYIAGDGEDDDAQEHVFLAGISFAVGARTLKENDRYGATLSSPMLVSRAAAWTEPLD